MQGQRDAPKVQAAKPSQGKNQNNATKDRKDTEDTKKQARSSSRKGGRSRNRGKGSNVAKKVSEPPRETHFSVIPDPGKLLSLFS